jgi:hypothetical protein
VLIASGVALVGSAAAPAINSNPNLKAITPAGVNGVRVGATYQHLRAARLIGPVRPGCELAGPQARSARLVAPLQGSVDFTQTSPRKVATIAITGGATAHGVGVGATTATIKHAFPTAVFDHGTDAMFAITLVKAHRSDVGRVQFGLDTKTKRVTLIGVPNIAFCE